MLVVMLTSAVGLFFAVAVLAALASVGKYNALVTLRKRCWEARQEIYQCDLQILAQMRALLQAGRIHLPTEADILCDEFEAAAHRSAAMLDEPSAVNEADRARRRILDFPTGESGSWELQQTRRGVQPVAEFADRPDFWTFRQASSRPTSYRNSFGMKITLATLMDARLCPLLAFG